MNLRYQGITGAVYYVKEDKIAGGGEGSIHLIENSPYQVAKIFREDRRTTEREEKLRHMVEQKLTEEQLKQITWPQDVIFDHKGFVGYIMPKLENTEPLNSIYSNGFDNKYDLRYRLLAALNLCIALRTIHESGQVCGDLNPQNICINLNTHDRINGFKVTLVDTDSYHFTSGNKTYRCEVGLGDYIAPELQNKMSGGLTLKNISLPTYTKETDLFALAVHIFTLLMNGCHPFACAKENSGKYTNTMEQIQAGTMHESVVAPQPIENIKNGFFPFYENQKGITYPLYAPSFQSLPENLQKLFVRTFVDGYTDPTKRATESEWIEALKAASANMSKCNEKQHYFFQHNTECSLCMIDKRIIQTMKLATLPTSSEKISDGRNEKSVNVYTQVKTKKPEWRRVGVLVACAIFMCIIVGSCIENTGLVPIEISHGYINDSNKELDSDVLYSYMDTIYEGRSEDSNTRIFFAINEARTKGIIYIKEDIVEDDIVIENSINYVCGDIENSGNYYSIKDEETNKILDIYVIDNADKEDRLEVSGYNSCIIKDYNVSKDVLYSYLYEAYKK